MLPCPPPTTNLLGVQAFAARKTKCQPQILKYGFPLQAPLNGNSPPTSPTDRMGFDKRLFLESPDAGLLCDACTDVFNDPISARSDGHPFCRDCLRRVKKCPKDGKPLRKTITPAPFLAIALSKLSMRCEHHADVAAKRQRDGAPAGRTCDWVGAYGEYNAHLTTCTAVLVDCTLGCGLRLARGDVVTHAKSVCGRRRVQCPDRKAEVTADNLATHSGSCLEKVIACGLPGCDTRMRRVHFELHRNICPRVSVPCSYASFGCAHLCPRADLEAHHAAATAAHLQLSTAKTKALEASLDTKTKALEVSLQSKTANLEQELQDLRKLVVRKVGGDTELGSTAHTPQIKMEIAALPATNRPRVFAPLIAAVAIAARGIE
jgi:hypothetical protein